MKNMALIAILITLAAFVAGCEREADRPIAPRGGPAVQQPALNVDSQVQFLRDVLKEDPDNLPALIKLGNITMDANRFEEAIEAYGRAIELDPTNVNVTVDRGICYRRIGRSDQAVEHFRKGIEANPNHALAHMNLGIVLGYDFQQYGEAAKELEKYLELSPAAPNRDAIEQIIRDFKSAAQAHPGQGATP